MAHGGIIRGHNENLCQSPSDTLPQLVWCLSTFPMKNRPMWNALGRIPRDVVKLANCMHTYVFAFYGLCRYTYIHTYIHTYIYINNIKILYIIYIYICLCNCSLPTFSHLRATIERQLAPPKGHEKPSKAVSMYHVTTAK